MDAVHPNDVTPCPVCDLDHFINAQNSSATPSEEDLSVHFYQKHNVRLSHKILAKSVLDMDISKETLTDVEEIAQDFLLVLENAKSLNDENSFLRMKLLECKNMAGSLWKSANDASNAGRGEFSPEEQIVTASQGKAQFNPAEQTCPQVPERIVVDQGEAMECFSPSLDQSEFSRNEEAQDQFTGSSSQAQIAEMTSSIFQNQILVSNENMEPQTVGKKLQILTGEPIETLENEKVTKISSLDTPMECSSTELKSDETVKRVSTMTREELGTKIKAKLKRVHYKIEVSADNLQNLIECAENMKTATNVSQKEVKDWSKKVEEYKSIHLKFEESLALKIKKLNDALKKLSLGEELIDSEFCELLEEIIYNSKEVRFAKKRVLKPPEDESDSDTDEGTDEPINYDPPSVPQVTQKICPRCNKAFKNMKDYKRHKIEHSHSQFFSCKICPQVFTNAATLLSHQKRHSGETGLKKCQFCNFTSKQPLYLLKHTRSIHTKEKLFLCDSCPLTFSSYAVLEDHVKKHKDKSKKQCEKCKRFHAKKSNHKC